MDGQIPEKNNPQTIYAWKAPLRPYKKRSAIIMRFYVAVCFLLSIIVFFLGDKILLIPVWAILFLFYILTITPPPEVENKITKFGVETAGITMRWEALSHFYFNRRLGFLVVIIVSHAPYFYHAYMVVPNEDVKKRLLEILSNHIIYQEKPQKTFTDKMVDWAFNLVPDEEDSSIKQPFFSAKPQPISP